MKQKKYGRRGGGGRREGREGWRWEGRKKGGKAAAGRDLKLHSSAESWRQIMRTREDWFMPGKCPISGFAFLIVTNKGFLFGKHFEFFTCRTFKFNVLHCSIILFAALQIHFRILKGVRGGTVSRTNRGEKGQVYGSDLNINDKHASPKINCRFKWREANEWI